MLEILVLFLLIHFPEAFPDLTVFADEGDPRGWAARPRGRRRRAGIHVQLNQFNFRVKKKRSTNSSFWASDGASS
jgi:hypothetical protein